MYLPSKLSLTPLIHATSPTIPINPILHPLTTSAGLSSVSTIEAIAHTARAAGLDESSFRNLLLLFRLQKLRVLDRVRQGNNALIVAVI